MYIQLIQYWSLTVDCKSQTVVFYGLLASYRALGLLNKLRFKIVSSQSVYISFGFLEEIKQYGYNGWMNG